MSNVRISTAIMTHPSRLKEAIHLQDAHPELDARIVLDPEPDAAPSTMRTALPSWAAVAPDATHHLVLQDDVTLCRDFPARLTAAVSAVPDRPLGLFTDSGTRTAHGLRIAAARGVSWAECTDHFVPAQAIVLHAAMARGFVASVAPDEDDDAVGLRSYLAGAGAALLVCVPNLVDHDAVPSLLGHDVLMGPRRSVLFIDNLPDGSEPTAEVLDDETLRPHLSTLDGVARCQIRQDGGWHAVEALDWLVLRGHSRARLGAWFNTDLAGAAMTGPAAGLGGPLLFQVWLTGIIYGWCLPPRPTPSVTWPVAMRTLTIGALRRFVAEALAAEVSLALQPLIDAGIARGRAESTAS